MYTKYIKLLDDDITSLQNQLEEKRQLRNHLHQKEGAKSFSTSASSPLSATPELPFTISPNLRAANMSEKVHALQSNALPFIPSAVQAESCGNTIHDTNDEQLSQNEGDRRSICVLGVDPATLKYELKKLFEAYGEIDRITIIANRLTQLRHCMAYIRFSEADSVEKAVSAQQIFILKGKRLTVTKKRTNVPGIGRNANQATLLGNLASFQEPFVPFQPTLQTPYDGIGFW